MSTKHDELRSSYAVAQTTHTLVLCAEALRAAAVEARYAAQRGDELGVTEARHDATNVALAALRAAEQLGRADAA